MTVFTNEQLCEHIKRGEKWAVDQLIEQNKGFVYDCAHKTYKAYRASHVLSETDEEDMVQEGLCALIAAVDSFDPTCGTLFLTYAGHAVQNAMLKTIANNPSRTMNGYRVRIFFDNKQNSRGASEAAAGRFRGMYPGTAVYRTYTNPFFKVTVGDFRTRSEALQLLSAIKNEFPSSFVVREKIN